MKTPLADPFKCKCGYVYIKDEATYSKDWRDFDPKISVEAVQKWITLSEEKKAGIRNLIVFEEIQYEQYPNAIEQILSIADDVPLSGDFEYKISTTSRQIRRLGKRLEEYSRLKDALESQDSSDYRAFDRFVEEQKSEIYWCTASVYSALAKHIRKIFLNGHQTCLHRAKRGILKCGYADVYIHWCKFIHSYGSYSKVDAGFRPNRPDKFSISYISKQDSVELHQLFRTWSGGKNREYESIAATKWVISKFLGMILLNHFYNWVEQAATRKTIREIHYLPFKYENLPLAVLNVPKDENKELEFHIWFEKSRMQYIKNLKLDCPYSTNKQRRNYDDDYLFKNEL